MSITLTQSDFEVYPIFIHYLLRRSRAHSRSPGTPFTLFLLPIVDIAQREGFLLNQELDDMKDMIQRLEEQGIALEKANN